MKIIFICGCLELGADGVGDYTRRLSAELVKQGHEIAILALNDQFITNEINIIEISENIKLQIYRIPSNWTSISRFKLAKKWVDEFNPEWLSLQYVPFSFNIKGLPFGLSRNLSSLKKRKWHIMFHELWVGMEKGTTLKLLMWGKVQRLLIKQLLANLKPTVVHTQTKLYQIQLGKLGIKAGYLPLFSNIPINNKIDLTSSIDSKEDITFVNFGTIHPNAPIETFSQEAAHYQHLNDVKINLILIGRCGNEQEHWVKIWKRAGLNIMVLGEQSTECISSVFSRATFGITTTALPLVEKSGSVAAMHEHNLPVICVSKPWYPKKVGSIKVPQGVVEYTIGSFNSFVTKTFNVPSVKVFNIAGEMAKSLM